MSLGKALKFVLLGYFAAWRHLTMGPFEIPAKCLTHVSYAFAKIENGVLVNGDEDIDAKLLIKNPLAGYDKEQPEYFNGLIESLTHPLSPISACNPNLKKLISVGGWNGSGEFSLVAGSAENRTRFAKSVVGYLERYRFDGIDMDWEYPVAGGLPTNVYSPDDKKNFVLLLKEMRRQMNHYQKRNHRKSPYLITAATAVSQHLTDNLDLEGMAEALDYFNLMIYDFAGAWDNTTTHNAPFNPAFIDTVKRYVTRHVSRSKLVTGMPLYGRRYQGVASGPQPGSGYKTIDDPISYDIIKDNLTEDRGYEHELDVKAGAGYLWNDQLKEWVTYEDPLSALFKANFVDAAKLAGMFVWELSMDRNADLIRVMREGMGLPVIADCSCNLQNDH